MIEGDFFQAGDFVALPSFDGFYEVSGCEQAFVGAVVKPGNATLKFLDLKVTAFQIGLVDTGDFQFA